MLEASLLPELGSQPFTLMEASLLPGGDDAAILLTGGKHIIRLLHVDEGGSNPFIWGEGGSPSFL
jgi:hypothetical protein